MNALYPKWQLNNKHALYNENLKQPDVCSEGAFPLLSAATLVTHLSLHNLECYALLDELTSGRVPQLSSLDIESSDAKWRTAVVSAVGRCPTVHSFRIRGGWVPLSIAVNGNLTLLDFFLSDVGKGEAYRLCEALKDQKEDLRLYLRGRWSGKRQAAPFQDLLASKLVVGFHMDNDSIIGLNKALRLKSLSFKIRGHYPTEEQLRPLVHLERLHIKGLPPNAHLTFDHHVRLARVFFNNSRTNVCDKEVFERVEQARSAANTLMCIRKHRRSLRHIDINVIRAIAGLIWNMRSDSCDVHRPKRLCVHSRTHSVGLLKMDEERLRVHKPTHPVALLEMESLLETDRLCASFPMLKSPHPKNVDEFPSPRLELDERLLKMDEDLHFERCFAEMMDEFN